MNVATRLVAALVADPAVRRLVAGPHDLPGTVRDRLRLRPLARRGRGRAARLRRGVHAYIGKRIARGDVIYRDLTENKPPLGYWLFALAVAIGGANETCIRLMPVPFVLLTIALVWWIACRLGGPVAGVAGRSDLCHHEHRPVPLRQRREHGALPQPVRRRRRCGSPSDRGRGRVAMALVVRGQCACRVGEPGQAGRRRPDRWCYAVALLLRQSGDRRSLSSRFVDLAALVAGFAAAWASRWAS